MDSPNHLDPRQRGDGKKKRQEAPPPVELGIGPKLKAFSDQKRTILKALASDCKDNSKVVFVRVTVRACSSVSH